MANVTTKLYKDNAGETTKAVQVTEKNVVGLGSWVNGDAIIKYNRKGEASDHRVKLQTVKGIRVARVGDYIVRGDTRLKTFYVVKKDDFEARWKLAK